MLENGKIKNLKQRESAEFEHYQAKMILFSKQFLFLKMSPL